MSILMQKLFYRLHSPAGEGDGGGGDRGDNFQPTDAATGDDAAAAAVADADAAAAATAAAAEAADAEGKGDGQPRDDKTGKFIPVDRHKAVLERERGRADSAERALADLQAQMAQVNRDVDVTKLEDQIMELRKLERKAIMSGDEEKSAQLSSDIDRMNRQIVIQESQHLSAQAKEEAREEIRVELAIEKLQETYDQLNETSQNFDQELTNYVLAEQRRLIFDERMSPSKALTKAANEIMKRFISATPADAAGAKGLAAATKGADRKAAQVAKNLDASKRQPQDSRDVGIDSDKAGIKEDIDVSKLSYSEFEALPEATKARLRGDLV